MTSACIELPLPLADEALSLAAATAFAVLQGRGCGCGRCGAKPIVGVVSYLPGGLAGAILPNGHVLVPFYVLCQSCRNDEAMAAEIKEDSAAVRQAFQPDLSFTLN